MGDYKVTSKSWKDFEVGKRENNDRLLYLLDAKEYLGTICERIGGLKILTKYFLSELNYELESIENDSFDSIDTTDITDDEIEIYQRELVQQIIDKVHYRKIDKERYYKDTCKIFDDKFAAIYNIGDRDFKTDQISNISSRDLFLGKMIDDAWYCFIIDFRVFITPYSVDKHYILINNIFNYPRLYESEFDVAVKDLQESLSEYVHFENYINRMIDILKDNNHYSYSAKLKMQVCLEQMKIVSNLGYNYIAMMINDCRDAEKVYKSCLDFQSKAIDEMKNSKIIENEEISDRFSIDINYGRKEKE